MVTLTERLLKESPSRELDAEIAKAIGLSWGSVVPRTHPMCPRFTTSIDAALTVARSDDERLMMIQFIESWLRGHGTIERDIMNALSATLKARGVE